MPWQIAPSRSLDDADYDDERFLPFQTSSLTEGSRQPIFLNEDVKGLA